MDDEALNDLSTVYRMEYGIQIREDRFIEKNQSLLSYEKENWYLFDENHMETRVRYGFFVEI